MPGALGRGAAKGGMMRQQHDRLERHRGEGDDPDEQGSPVDEIEEMWHRGEIHKPEGKTYS
jgi:hypothetical protein